MSQIDRKLNIINAKLNMVIELIEDNPFPRRRASSMPVPQRTAEDTFEFTFSQPTPTFLSNLLNLGTPGAPNTNTTNTGLSVENILENTTQLLYSAEDEALAGTDRCTICHEPFNEGDIIRKINACGHFFHTRCIDQWFTTNSTCPVCRQSLL